MDLKKIISKECVNLNLKATNKEDVFEELTELLFLDNKIKDKKEFLKALYEREELGITGMDHGIAIPHGISDTVEEPSIAYGYQNEGVEYETIGSEKIKMIFMIAIPKECANEHLKIISSLCRKLVHKEFIEELNQVETVDEFLNLFD